ncbi:MAG: tetratricopeptide repeat protein [Planctomycetota bacterium]
MRTPGWFLLFGLLFACATDSADPVADDGEAPAAIPDSLTVVEYDGALAVHPPATAGDESLSESTAWTADLVSRRLGLALDPDRPRVLEVAEVPVARISTRLIDGRTTQVLSLPHAPLVRGTVLLREVLLEVLARAALSDVDEGELPGWYRSGAPLWVSGAGERVLYGRILSGPVVPADADDITTPILMDGEAGDALSSALFFRFLAEEFGADRIPSLTRALLSAETWQAAFGAAFDTEPESLPLAFDSFRAKVVDGILAEDEVRRLAASRRRPPEERVSALTGLADGATSPFVACAILSELALAQFETGEFEAAAATWSRIESEHAAFSMTPDRDLLYHALTFARTGDSDSARFHLELFLAEHPDSRSASLGLMELAALHLAAGDTDAAMARYEEVATRFPESPHALAANLVLAATARSGHRYAVARRHLVAAGPEESATGRLAELDAELARGLPDAARPAVRSAVRDLTGADERRAEAAVKFLVDVGPVAREELATPFPGRQQFARPAAARLRALRVIATWTREEAWPDPLAGFLHGDDATVARAVFDILAGHDVADAEIEKALDLTPFGVAAARAELDRRLRGRTGADALAASEDFRERLAAAGRLATEENEEAVTLLARLLGDVSPQVRRAAAASLGRRSEPGAVRALSAGLEDESRLVREEVLRSYARHGELEPVRERGLADPAAGVRIEAGRILLTDGVSEDVVDVVRLLDDPDATVRKALEEMLREENDPVLGPVLAQALSTCELPGHAIRIVRLMSHHTGIDFGYDAYGGAAERERVAIAFRKAWLRRKKR